MGSTDWIADYLETSKREFDHVWEHKQESQDNIWNFKLIRTLGAGSFGRVMLATHKVTEKVYAVKILNKGKVVKMKQIEHTISEKRILQSTNCVFVVRLHMAFKDTTNLYMVMDFVNGGELFTLLRKKNKFPEEWARVYSGQILLALQYLHNANILYRDLKPENILLDNMGYLKLGDFGFAKRVLGHTWTLCGTPQYLAPEIILSKSYGKSVDYWGLGIFIYEMVAGVVPFDHKVPIKLYEMIVSCDLKFPSHFKAPLRDLLSSIIQVDVTKRYGNLKNGALDIIQHPWYKELDFRALLKKTVPSPFMPKLKNPMDTSMFEVYKEESIAISKTDKYKEEFADF